MGDLAFLTTILGANVGLIAFAIWIVGDERAEYYDRLAAIAGTDRAPFLRRGA